MKGLILAAGKGKRLKPLTDTTPKALIPIKGQPLIIYPLLRLKSAGIKKIGIVIAQNSYSKFKSAIKIPDLDIKYIFQNKPLGTAKATECAQDFIKSDRFALCWCDFFTPYDFNKLILEHIKLKPAATVLINREKDPSGTAQVIFRGNRITRIVEKPRKMLSLWGSTGLLILEPEIFSALTKIKPSSKGEYHIADALQYIIDIGRPVIFKKLDTWRININTLHDLELARNSFLQA